MGSHTGWAVAKSLWCPALVKHWLADLEWWKNWLNMEHWQSIRSYQQSTMEDCKLLWSKTEHHRGVGSNKLWSSFNLHFLINLCYLLIIFWNLFYHFMMLSIFFKIVESHLVYITYFIIDSREEIFVDQIIKTMQSWCNQCKSK